MPHRLPTNGPSAISPQLNPNSLGAGDHTVSVTTRDPTPWLHPRQVSRHPDPKLDRDGGIKPAAFRLHLGVNARLNNGLARACGLVLY